MPDVGPLPDPSSMPDVGPISDLSSMPDLGPLHDPSSMPDAGPLPDLSSMPDVGPLPDPSSMPDVGPLPDLSSMPDVGPLHDPSSMPDAGPLHDPSSMPDAGPLPDPSSMPDVGPLPDLSSMPDVGPLPDPSTMPDVGPIPDLSSMPDVGPLPDLSSMPLPTHDNFASLKQYFAKVDCSGFNMISHSSNDKLSFVQFYPGPPLTAKTEITVSLDGDVSLHVHNREVPKTHEIWTYLSNNTSVAHYVENLMERLEKYKICIGNTDDDMLNLTPVGCSISMPDSLGAYREGNFNAVCGKFAYTSSVRHTHCSFLIDNEKSNSRCPNCSKVRGGLRARRTRQKNKENSFSGIKKTTPNSALTPEEKDLKLKMMAKEQKVYKRRLHVLEDRVVHLEQRIRSEIESRGESLSLSNSDDLKTIMQESGNYIRQTFGQNSFQSLFFEQQLKYNELRSKSSMRWHPMMIRWCLYLRSKSSKAYNGIRHVLALPSERTLFDYSHATESGTGIKESVVAQLIKEAQNLDLYSTDHKKYVGIIHDEVRIKSDLVFNKHTGELVGFLDLGSVGNELKELERALNGKDQVVAKYMLVVMVRGVTSSLQFPLAAYATEGVTADFLYPIIWEAIEHIHRNVNLNVLFICCDGASPNRKFFTLHSQTNKSTLHKTENIFSEDEEDIYFISDPPHLLKTTRNCFSNSHFHKRSRLLWNGGDISWLHIVKLFQEHCTGPLRLCHKLTAQHVYLTPLSLMKVNLAAQIMSNTVANGLEFVCGQEVQPTVQFIKHINKWFDMMNIRSLNEAGRTRNVDLVPFRSVDDARLVWLEDDFLRYFTSWSEAIDQSFPQLSAKDKAAMKLSRQTLNGLQITTKSVVASTRFLLLKGADFILTEHFNQDPLERHFSHYRQKGGMNENPTVDQVCHIINQVRTVKLVGLAPKRGNVRNDGPVEIDHEPLPKRPRNGGQANNRH